MTEQEVAPQLTPEQLEEVLMPDLSTDSFTIGDKKYKIRMLPMFYERRLFHLMKANWAALTDTGSWMDFADVLLAKLPEVVALICYSQGAKGGDPAGSWNEEKSQEIVLWIERVAAYGIINGYPCGTAAARVVMASSRLAAFADRPA